MEWMWFQLWSSKWSIKDEHKLLSELGGGGGTGNGGGTGGGGGGGGYYEHGGFPGNAIATSAELYDSLGTISTMTQAQTSHLYTPPIGGTIGERLILFLFTSLHLTLPDVTFGVTYARNNPFSNTMRLIFRLTSCFAYSHRLNAYRFSSAWVLAKQKVVEVHSVVGFVVFEVCRFTNFNVKLKPVPQIRS